MAGRHTGRTDMPLIELGRTHARALHARLQPAATALVLCSPLVRAAETADLAGYGDRAEVFDDLAEWHYGDYEGLTTHEIRVRRPDWDLWRDGAPGGESPADVELRTQHVVDRVLGTTGDVLVFAHGHLLRALAARWLRQPLTTGALLALNAGSVSVLGWERDTPVIRLWNDVSHFAEAPATR